MHLYTVKVEKTQKFLDFYKLKSVTDKKEPLSPKMNPIIGAQSMENMANTDNKTNNTPKSKTPPTEHQQGDSKQTKVKPTLKKKTPADMKYLESMPLEEFAKTENLDKTLLNSTPQKSAILTKKSDQHKKEIHKHEPDEIINLNDTLDPIVLIDGRPAKQGTALDKQITLFYKMECCICHENGFHFRSLMKHYKERHGVPGYVTCCDKKFHYFYPKKIIEHMAYHLQTNIFM